MNLAHSSTFARRAGSHRFDPARSIAVPHTPDDTTTATRPVLNAPVKRFLVLAHASLDALSSPRESSPQTQSA
jgi:hypothetical protein